ncbi:hypothetical protein SAMN05216277_10638 [Halolamina pelagica]|uniref:Uncharacterized protein n=2 Tax=Haloferacaceae TaxID=1644056 RepID=A0A1I5SB72_9EURY|nr:hypothetical protein SAMN05216277_10638 [Halolamina pelagica]
MGTGAFTAAELDGREADISVVDDTNGLIGLDAGTTELVSNDGGANSNELVIDFNPDDHDGEGVNPNSKYQVGGMGGIGNLDEVPGNPTNDLTLEDLAIDTTSDIEEHYAFRLLNQSGSDHAVEVTYQANEDLSEAEVYMVSQYEEGDGDPEKTSALVATATPDAREASIIYSDATDYSTDVDPGTDVKVSLLVVVDDADTGDELGGSIVVRAGSHDDFNTADQ